MEPRLIVEVRYGKLGGTKRFLEPGGALRVGRTDLADLVIPHDTEMSGVHFELRWDGARCAFRDLESVSGTRLGGREAREAEIPHGGWIQAGETDFMVYVEGRTPPGRRKLKEHDRAAEPARLAAAESVLQSLRLEAAEVPLYAVLDGARDRRILELVREHVEPHQSLYDGLQGEAMEDLAPYLVGPMREDSALLERLLVEGWGRRWGMYCASFEKFVEVRRHWRRFLMVELEATNQRVYFRFYDPGVLRAFWPTCNAGQRDKLAEGIEEIFVEEKDFSRKALLRATRGGGGA